MMMTLYPLISARAGIRFCPVAPKSRASTFVQNVPQAVLNAARNVGPSVVPHAWRIRTLAPPFILSIGCQPEVVPSRNVHRYSHVSSKPGSENWAVRYVGLPSSPGLGVVRTLDTIGATLFTSKRAVSAVASGRISVYVHWKSIVGMNDVDAWLGGGQQYMPPTEVV